MLIISLCWINWVWNRIAEAKMWTSAFTKERSSLLSTLPPNGIPFPLFCFCFGLLIILSYADFVFCSCFGFWNSGFTNSNYTQLTDLYNKYKDNGSFLFIFYFLPSSNVSCFKCKILFSFFPFFKFVIKSN